MPGDAARAVAAAPAGFGKVEISTRTAGAELVGYGAPERRALSVHDPLHVRALVLGSGARRVAICAVELCYVGADVIAAARERIERATGIRGERVLVCASHTHSGPHDGDRGCWPDGLDAPICAAVEQACERAVPALAGAGWGTLHGVAINRRRLEDPVDPAVLVLRVDAADDGRPLGAWFAFGCHPVVLGPDNPHVSGDWPASAAQAIERRLGDGAVAVFGLGAAADVNPLTPELLERLGAGRAVRANAPGAVYYGPAQTAVPEDRIGNRRGGTFAEAERLGGVVAGEVLRVHRGIAARPVDRLWTRRLQIATREEAGAARASAAPVDASAGDARAGGGSSRPAAPLGGAIRPRARRGDPLDVLLVGVEPQGVALVGAPVELFCESGVRLRRSLRALGVPHPFAVGCANGWRGYLPPARAFAEGGYEVAWAQAGGLPGVLEPALVDRVVDAVADAPVAFARAADTVPGAAEAAPPGPGDPLVNPTPEEAP